MSRPTFICVPGFCHTSAIFDPLRDLLGSYGYAVHPVTLPSIVTNGTPTSNDPAQDMRAIRSTVSRYVEAGHYVIVVLHSYAGVPGGDALQGLSHSERAQRGLRGGVLRVVYVVGWIVKEGFKMCQEGDYSSFPPYLQSNTTSRYKVGTVSISAASAVQTFYNDLPAGHGEYYAQLLRPQTTSVLYHRTTTAAWRSIPTTYVLCPLDNVLTDHYARLMLSTAQESGSLIDSIEVCEGAGSCCWLGSGANSFAEVLRRAAGENV
ncbi:FAD binding domain-containing protein [Rutstroemia sp. NJR-2017a BBW]|nr:FAD binding domain-containing protein [Rutstroemia sp. NJR-2017a BBW]